MWELLDGARKEVLMVWGIVGQASDVPDGGCDGRGEIPGKLDKMAYIV
jgi:hypothetical protein